MQRYGGEAAEWIDLSTGINRRPYPVPDLPARSWTGLPTRAAIAALVAAARQAYRTDAAILPVAGAQTAIQMIPRQGPPGRARILGPTYNEHAAALHAAGWIVDDVAEAAQLDGADLAVIVNPNNPDGRVTGVEDLRRLATRVGRLVIDESFADPFPEISAASEAGKNAVIVLRSFGKFYGLAGLRLGFVIASEADIADLSEMSGPWPVSGAAIEIGCRALRDETWAMRTTERLLAEVPRLDRLVEEAGWTPAGGSALFRLYATPDAGLAQDRLARARIWSRRFPYSQSLLRLGLPGTEAEWQRLEEALAPRP